MIRSDDRSQYLYDLAIGLAEGYTQSPDWRTIRSCLSALDCQERVYVAACTALQVKHLTDRASRFMSDLFTAIE